MEYQPGWGDALSQALPALANNVRKIINPHADLEDALRQRIAEDPTVLQRLAEAEANSPGSMGNVFGPNVGEFAKGLGLSPQQVLQRDIASAGSETLKNPRARVEAGANATGTLRPGQRAVEDAQAIEAGVSASVTRTMAEQLVKLKESDPEKYAKIIQDGALRKFLGTSLNAAAQGEFADLADKASKTYSSEQLAQMFLKGEPVNINGQQVPVADVIQGLFTRRPEATQAIFNWLGSQNELEARKQMTRLAQQANAKDFMQQVYLETTRRARALKLPANALFVYEQGEEALAGLKDMKIGAEAMPTPEQLADVDKYFSNQSTIQGLKASAPFNAAMLALGSAKTAQERRDAAIALNSTLAQLSISNIAADINGNILHDTDGDGKFEKVDARGFIAKYLRIGDVPIAPSAEFGGSAPTGRGKINASGMSMQTSDAADTATNDTTELNSAQVRLLQIYTDMPDKSKALQLLRNSQAFKALSKEEQDTLLANLPAE